MNAGGKKVKLKKYRSTPLRNLSDPSTSKANGNIDLNRNLDVDVRLFHRKTASRISEKIKEYSEEKKLEQSLEKAKDDRFRLKWRDHVRRDAQQRVVYNVDKSVLEDTIKKRPNVVLNLKISDLPLPFPTSTYESTLHELVSDLIPMHEDKEEAENRTARNKFLFHGDSSDDDQAEDDDGDDNHNTKHEQRSSRAEEADKKTLESLGPRSRFIWPPHGGKQRQRSPTTRVSVRSNSRSGGHHSRFRCRSKDMRSAKAMDISDPMLEDDNNGYNRCIKTVGLMARIVRKRERISNKSEDSMGLGVHSNQSLPNLKDVLNISRNNSNENPANTPIAQTASPAAVITTPATASPLFSSLAECLFLIGPSKAALDDAIRVELMNASGKMSPLSGEEGHPSSANESSNPNLNADGGSSPSWDVEVKLPPTILFMTECNNPNEMLSLLPTYCYPSDVDARISMRSPSQSNYSSRRKATLKKFSSQYSSAMSVNSHGNSNNNSNGRATNDQAVSPGESDSDKDKVNTTPNTEKTKSRGPQLKSKKSLLIDTHYSGTPTGLLNMKSHFVLVFGDHTYQQYGLCMRMPMKFTDPTNQVGVHTSYVVCVMSKFPFFNYLFALIDDFDVIAQGFKFSKPLAVQEIDFLLQNELKLLNEFAGKLKKTVAPIYPYIFSYRHENLSNDVTNKSATATAPDGPKSPTDEAGPSDGISQTYALLSDVDFSLSDKKQKKIDMSFQRSVYQSYFSSYPASVSEETKLNEVITMVRNLQRKQNDGVSFSPSWGHKLEKEREDAYLTLLWALPVLLKHLPLDQIVLALGCAITEMKIIVKHKDFHVISTIILALTSLLLPLHWCSPMIVILPDNLLDFIESPVPIIIGLHELPSNFLLLERFVVIDPQKRMVHLNESDVVVSHTISLPHASKLIQALREPTDVILALSRKRNPKFRRKQSINRTMNNHSSPPQSSEGPNFGIVSNKISSAIDLNRKSMTDIFDNHTPVNPNLIQTTPTTTYGAITSGIPPTIPNRSIVSSEFHAAVESTIPLPLDVGSDGNKRLLDAINTFAQHVSSHIQAIINSAILFCHEEKAKERAARITKARSAESHLQGKADAKGRKKSVRIVGSSLDSLSLSQKPRVAASTKAVDIPFQRPPVVPKNNSGIMKSTTRSADDRADLAEIQPENKHLIASNTLTNSRLDEEMSEITCTERADTVVDEEVEGGDLNNKDSILEYSDDGTASSNSSLPSLKKNVSLLNIGDTATKFIKRLLDTQMFSNFCENAKSRSRAANASPDNQQPILNNISSFMSSKIQSPVSFSSGTVLGSKNFFGPDSGSIQQHGSASHSEYISNSTPNHMKVDELDALTTAFELIISGTCSLERLFLDGEINTYKQLYSNSSIKDADALLKECTKKVVAKPSRGGFKKHVSMLYSEAIKKYGSISLLDSGGKKEDLIDVNASITKYGNAFLWCNGLLCKGFCNSPFCSSICLKLWTEMVLNLRKQALLKDIIDRNKTANPNLVMQTHVVRIGESNVPISLKPQTGVRKHPNETESQFLQRKQINEMQEKSDNIAFLRGVTPKNVLPKRKDEKIQKKDIHGPKSHTISHNDEKRLQYKSTTYASRSTADSATLQIAKYYARKQKKYLVKRAKRALSVLRAPLLRFITLFRRIKVIQSAVIIQSLARGLFIRNRIPELVEALITRKIERLLACIRIRRFFRQRKFSVPIALMQRRRSISSEKGEMVLRSKSYQSMSATSSCSLESKLSEDSVHAMPNAKSLLPENIFEEKSMMALDIPSYSTVSLSQSSDKGRLSPVVTLSLGTYHHPLIPSDTEMNGRFAEYEAPDKPTAGPLHLSREPSGNLYSDASSSHLRPDSSRVADSTCYDDSNPENIQQSSEASSIKSSLLSDSAKNRNLGGRDAVPSTDAGSVVSTSSSGSSSATNITYQTSSTIGVSHLLSIPQHSSLNSTGSSALNSKAKEFLLYGKISHRVSNSYNSSLQNLIYSKGLSDQSYHGSSGAGSVSKEQSAPRSKNANGDMTSRSSSPLPVIKSDDLSTTSNTSSVLHLSAAVVPQQDVHFPSNIKDGLHNFTAASAPSSKIEVIERPTSSANLSESSQYQEGDSNNGFNGDDSALADSPSIQSDNFSFFEYPVRNRVDGVRDYATLPLRVTVPLVPDPYKSSDEEEEEETLNPRPRTLSKVDKHSKNDAKDSDNNCSMKTLQHKPNLMGSIKIEDYFVSNKSKSEGMIDISNISRSRIRKGDGGTHESRYRQEQISKDLGATIDKELLPSSSMVSGSLCQDDESRDDAASEIGTVRTQQNFLESTTLMEKGFMSENNIMGIAHSPLHKATTPVSKVRAPVIVDIISKSHSGGPHNPSSPYSQSGDDVRLPFKIRRAHRRAPNISSTIFPMLSGPITSSYEANMRTKKSPIGRYLTEENNYKLSSISNNNMMSSTVSDAGGFPSLSTYRDNISSIRTDRKNGIMNSQNTDGMIARGDSMSVLSSEREPLPLTPIPIPGSPLSHSRKSSGSKSLQFLDDAANLQRCTAVDSLPGGRNTSFMSRSETNTDPDAYPLYMLDEDYYDDNIELDEDSSSRPIDVDQEAKRAPLKTLGEDVGDFLTPQQLTTVLNMWKLLRGGTVKIIKHGRSGKPKPRILLCDQNMTILYWRAVGSNIDPELDELGTQEALILGRSNSAHPGGGIGSGAMKKLFNRRTSIAKSDNERMIFFHDIKEVRDDYNTEVMQRSAQKNYFSASGVQGISIVMEAGDKQRTLDFEIEEKHWGSIFHALQILVNFYNVIRPHHSVGGHQPGSSFTIDYHAESYSSVVTEKSEKNDPSQPTVSKHNLTQDDNVEQSNRPSNRRSLFSVSSWRGTSEASDEHSHNTALRSGNSYLYLNNLVFHHTENKKHMKDRSMMPMP